MIYEKLQKIGLDEKEARIYVALLELGETSIQRVSKKSKIKRTTVYNIIDILKDKGLISIIIKKRRKYYCASDPRELEHRLDEQKQSLKALLPELLSISNLIDKKPRIRFFEGDEGLKEIYLDTLSYPEKPLWAWVTDDVFTRKFDEEFLKYYIPMRVKNKIMAFVIAPNSPEMKSYKNTDLKSLRQTRIDLSGLNYEVEIDIYGGNKVSVLSFKEKIGLIIESQTIYNTMKSIFDNSWKNLER